ncbi:MAG: hypothetical protein WKF37_24400, partial [Bryobacteraceae bacterium]
FQRFNLDFSQEGAVEGGQLGEKLGVRGSNQGPRANGFPIFSPSDYQGIGMTRSLPIIRRENTFNPVASFTNILSRHTMKYGADIRRRQLTIFQTNRGNGRFNFNAQFTSDPNRTANTGDALASFLLGTASTIEQDFLLAFVGMRGTEYGSYIQDHWRVTDKLVLNIGLRYEYDTPYSEVADRWTNFDVTTGKLLIAGFNTDKWAGVKPDRNNWATRRVSTAANCPARWSGNFYNAQGSEAVNMRMHRQVPFGPINAIQIDQFNNQPRPIIDGLPPIPVLDFAIVSANPTGNLLAIDPNFKNGYAIQFNFQVQQELPWNMVAKVGYVGNLNRQLDNSYNINQPDPGPGTPASRRPLRFVASNVADVTYALSDGNANYHSLQATAEKRFSAGLSFLTAYTWSHSIDNIGNAFGGGANGPLPQDIRYRFLDRGRGRNILRGPGR